MAIELSSLCDDLLEEQRALASRVHGLSDEFWHLPTPAQDWTVADAFSHLCYFTEQALLAVEKPARFVAERSAVVDVSPRPDLALSGLGPQICRRWMSVTEQLINAILAMPGSARVPWYGPSMSTASFVTARIMETWAHGQDVADALDLPPLVSRRLRHVCHLGVLTRGFAYSINGIPLPSLSIAVRLTGPDGEQWTWNGEENSEQRIAGTAADFALVVTQRRHVEDTALEVVGDAAEEWMEIAQAFAGRPSRPQRHRAAR